MQQSPQPWTKQVYPVLKKLKATLLAMLLRLKNAVHVERVSLSDLHSEAKYQRYQKQSAAKSKKRKTRSAALSDDCERSKQSAMNSKRLRKKQKQRRK